MLPTVHYNMGGIPTKYTGEVITKGPNGEDKIVPGLYAAGETACVSVHGANRLGANSLLDIVVFGRACANHIKENLDPGKPHKELKGDAGAKSINDLDWVRNANGTKTTADIRNDMQRVMQSDAAVFRTQKTLDEGVEKIDKVYSTFPDVSIQDRSMIWNSDLVETLVIPLPVPHLAVYARYGESTTSTSRRHTLIGIGCVQRKHRVAHQSASSSSAWLERRSRTYR